MFEILKVFSEIKGYISRHNLEDGLKLQEYFKKCNNRTTHNGYNNNIYNNVESDEPKDNKLS